MRTYLSLLLVLAGCNIRDAHFTAGGGGDGGPGDGGMEAVDIGSSADAASAFLQQAYIKASNTDRDDQFSGAIALSADGSTMAVGAASEDSAATIDPNDNSTPNAGAVYVFTRNGDTWMQQAFIKASNANAEDVFGVSVSLSADGGILAVGASGESSSATGVGGNQADNSASRAGAAYVFTRSGSIWTQQAYLKASNTGADDTFGAILALSGDGLTLAVSAVGEASVATGVGGNQGDNSASGAGAVYVFTRTGAVWSQQAYIKASNTDADDGFGWSLAVANNGSTLAISSVAEDSAATGIDGNQGDDSAGGSGAAYVFTRSGTTWSQQAYVKPSTTRAGSFFGSAVTLAADGSTLAVGEYYDSSAATGIGGNQNDSSAVGAGAAFVFARTGTTWSQQAYVKASNTNMGDSFGAHVSLSADGSTLAVSAPGESSSATGVDGDQANNSLLGAGAVYVFERAGTTWTQQAYIKASNPDSLDAFGVPVMLSGDHSTLAVGAPAESSPAVGIGGDQSSNTEDHAGAVYVLRDVMP